MSDDTPTQRFDQPVPPPPDEEEKKSRALLIILIVVGAVLLAAIIIILVLLLGRNATNTSATGTPTPTITVPSPTPTPSVTPTTTPTPTPTPSTSHTTAPPPPPTLAINGFSAGSNNQVKCSNQTGNPVPMTFTWTSTNGSQAYFGVNVPAGGNAKDMGMGWNLPPSGTQHDFPYEYDYPCYNASTTFTITVADSHGNLKSKTITVTNIGDTHS